MRGAARAFLTALLLGSSAGCGAEGTPTVDPHPAPDPIEEALARLRRFEERERAAADFASLLPASETLGADPYALAAVTKDRAVGILRGDDAIVLYDRVLARRARAPFEAPTGLAVCDGRIHVVGELSRAVTRLHVAGDSFVTDEPVAVAGAVALRSVACAGDALYVVDEAADRLTTHIGDEQRSVPICEGPVEVARTGELLLVRCLIDHTVVVRHVDHRGAVTAEGETRIRHDGPIWAMHAWRAADGVSMLALGGVEDRPLDRSEGFFGNIDSFVFLYRLGETVERVAERNVSEQGIVTPKALVREGDTLLVAGYGSAGALVLGDGLAVLERRPQLPGATALSRFGDHLVAANPLLDAWVVDGKRVVNERAPADPEQRLGEVLAFTTLMAPRNAADGSRSRFTCETCHFEGYGDGRTHHTGRAVVRATTKPLYGLFNNRPHFTRALDRDLTKVAHAEFRVAGKGSDLDPWFSLEREQHPWLAHVDPERDAFDPETLRRSLMRFFMAFNHRPSPYAHGLGAFDAEAREGARVFRDRCAGCHAPRLSTDDPATAVDLGAWERLVLGGGPIVWARPGYEKTGVTPYVHPEGARPPSLRRLYRKRPYFTNGSAATLEEVLARVAFDGESFFHDGAPAGSRRLAPAEQKALASFLRLL